MNSKVYRLLPLTLQVYFGKLCLALGFALVSTAASAIPTSLVIDNTFTTPQVFFVDRFVYSPQVQTSFGRVTVTGGLDDLRQLNPGKFAVVLLGFKDDIVLVDSLLGEVITYPDPSNPTLEEIYHLFKVEFYSDPQGLGFDPVELLSGYATTYFSKTLANTCPIREDYCWAVPDGYFGLTAELGGSDVHGLVIAVNTGLLPEPGSALLLLSGLLGLGVTGRHQVGRLVKRG